MRQEKRPASPGTNRSGARRTGGRRLAKQKRRRAKSRTGAAVLVVLAAVLAGYIGLCAWAGARIPEGVTVELQPGGQELVLGGLTTAKAKQLLSDCAQVDGSRTLSVTCGDQTGELSAAALTADTEGMLQTLAQAEDLIISRPFLTRGIDLLLGRQQESSPVRLRLERAYRFTADGEKQADALLDRLAGAVQTDPIDPVYTVGEESIEVVCGTPGTAVDREKAKATLLEALASGQTAVTLSPEAVPPKPLDAAALNEEIFVEAEPVKTARDGTITPAVVGTSIDVDAAQAALDAAVPGQVLSIPIVHAQPDYAMADEQGLLYKDLLSECKTYVGGSANRVYNVSLAASHCNGVLLMPGDVFSYHDAVGDCTVAEGYAVDLGFAGGQTVDMVGGGICQVSSSLYYCTLYANLEVVERRNHAFTVDYLAPGLDATFYSTTPDYRFRNSTGYPLKITAGVKDRTLTVRFYGTNPDGTYVTTERSQVASVDYTTVYKPDETVPVGTTKVETTPYTGVTIEVYRCVYAADGTLLSRTHENTSKYSKRDKVVLYNPADAASLGLETPPPVESPPVQVPPVETPPVESPPVESPPAVTPPAESPPAESPPAESPPAETPPAETVPAETPPAESPPAETSPEPETAAQD